VPLFPRSEPAPNVRGRVAVAERNGNADPIDAVSLVAAANPVVQAEISGGRYLLPGFDRWQTRAFGYYDMMGECWLPCQFIPGALSRIRFYPATLDDDGQWQEVEDPAVQQMVAPLNLVKKEYGRLMFLVGEGRLCASRHPAADPDEPVEWEFLSAKEIKVVNEGRDILRHAYGGVRAIEYRNISDTDSAEPEPGEMRIWRMWNPRPDHSHLADSPIRGVLELYEQLWWLRMSERADLQSRIAQNGIIVIPEEIEFDTGEGPEEGAQSEDPDQGGVVNLIAEASTAAISDPGTAPSRGPIVLEVPAIYADPNKIFTIDTHEGSIGMMYASERDKSLKESIMQGLPLPPEAFLGMSGANHWTAWKIEDQKWQDTEPWVAMFCQDTTQVYLQPLLRANNLPDNIVVAYDNSALVADPDRGKTAVSLHKEGLLAAAPTLAANGWGEQDAMEGEELDWWRAIQLRDATIATGEPGEVVQVDERRDEDVDVRREPDEDDAAGETRPDDTATVRALRQYALTYANTRARATAGAMVRGSKRSCPECLETVKDQPNEAVLAALGPDVISTMKISTDKLVAAMAGTFVSTVEALGFSGAAASGAVARWYASTLYSPTKIPSDVQSLIRYRNGDST
jgi:hypothetical protein